MEVLWKAISIIIYQNLVESIDFHDIMHRFRFWRGIGTATLEAKILQKIAGIRQEVLYDIFVDIHMAYDALDWGHVLVILEGYGVGGWDPRSDYY